MKRMSLPRHRSISVGSTTSIDSGHVSLMRMKWGRGRDLNPGWQNHNLPC